MEILVSGAGIAGTTISYILKQAGHNVTLIDKANKFTSAGYGLYIWQNGYFVLEKLGLANDLFKNSKPIKTFLFKDENFETFNALELPENNNAYKIQTIKRSELQEKLNKLIPDIKIKFNTYITKLSYSKNKVIVNFNDKSRHNFDLHICAEGIHSSTRELLNRKNLKNYNWSSYIFDLPEKYENMFKENEVSIVLGKNSEYISFLPLTKRKKYIYLSCKEQHDLDFPKRSTSYDELYNYLIYRFKEFSPQLINIIKEKNEIKHVYRAPLESINLRNPSFKRTIFIGDSAHSFPPHLGMGANMALEDAYIVGYLINKEEKKLIDYKSIELICREYWEYKIPIISRLSKVNRALFFIENSKLIKYFVKKSSPFSFVSNPILLKAIRGMTSKSRIIQFENDTNV